MTMIATIRKPLMANAAAAGVSASLIPTELGYASGLAMLSRFSQLMNEDGLSVDTRRMQSDSAYAFEQLALAHTSTYERLRHCAMQVFALFHE
jgi:glutaminase